MRFRYVFAMILFLSGTAMLDAQESMDRSFDDAFLRYSEALRAESAEHRKFLEFYYSLTAAALGSVGLLALGLLTFLNWKSKKDIQSEVRAAIENQVQERVDRELEELKERMGDFVGEIRRKVERVASELEDHTADAKRKRESDLYAEEARIAFAGEKYDYAMKLIEKALDIDPKSTRALSIKCRILKKQGQVEAALDAAQRTLEIDEGNETALYNSACYKALLKYSEAEVLADLSRAIAKLEDNRSEAMTDPDFDELRQSSAGFRILVYGNPQQIPPEKGP